MGDVSNDTRMVELREGRDLANEAIRIFCAPFEQYFDGYWRLRAHVRRAEDLPHSAHRHAMVYPESALDDVS